MISSKILRNQNGFTLVEIMIALLIGLFLAAGASQLFLNSNKSNRLQENLSRMQENARFALRYLREDIQRTNFFGGGCLKSAGTIINNLDTSTLPPYNPLLHSFILPQSLAGAVSGANGTVSGANSAFDIADTITLRAFFNMNVSSLSEAMGSDTAPVVAKGGSGFVEDDIVLITDCSRADIFQITDNTSDALAHALGHADIPAGVPGNVGLADPIPLSGVYPKDSYLYKLSKGTSSTIVRTYSIGPSGPNNTPSLMRNNGAGNDALVGDIENMQISYGVNTSNVSDAANFNTPNYYTANIGGLTADELEDIRSVRISLLVRSPNDNVISPRQAYSFNGGLVSGADLTDNRMRRVYTSTIVFRNRQNFQ